jgi:hypothetical protein
VKHAGPEALDRLEPLLAGLRTVPGLVEKKRGTFYRRSKALLHFHEDPTGLYVDVRLDEDRDFVRRPVNTLAQRSDLLRDVRTHCRAPSPA